ncbi:MAG: hypothetical protein K0S38_418, partial [Candidatus Paceibacter sp.]|nr:hypothetical protein [Candidatus Paceibacter sp.]
TSTIGTGQSVSNTDLTNVVNVNIYNSEALYAFLNRLASGDDSVDLRDALSFSDGGTSCSDCSVSTSPLTTGSTTITDNSSASIDNAVVVRSGTGDNTASSTGNAEIYTGNAYANANVFNMINTNIIESHYVMLVFNNFGSLAGDIILPNASFFDQFLNISHTTSNSTNPLSINATNTAEVTSGLDVDAQSGNNTATSTDSSSIDTGDAFAGSTVLNTINENHIGSNKIAIIFRVYGNWSGEFYNLPSSFTANGTPVGIEFLNNPKDVLGAAGGNDLTIATENSALIHNSISVGASTGNNNATGKNTKISTGNAYANANVINVANTNIIGSNWITAIINIFGNWTGNVSFGQPDLWVGTRADFVNGHYGESGQVAYHYTVKNNGDAPAHNIKVGQTFSAQWLSFEGGSTLDIGTLNPGESREVTRIAQIASILPFGNVPVSSDIKVSQTETDGNTRDNTDTISVMLAKANIQGAINYEPVTHGMPAHFQIAKTNSATSIIAASSTVDYTITIKNLGGASDHAILVDDIKNEQGDVIYHEVWDLGKVASQESITVSYTAFFNASTTEGIYTNYAQVQSLDGYSPDSSIAISSVMIGEIIYAPLVWVERPIPIFTPLVVEASPKKEIIPTSTTTATTSVVAAVTPNIDVAEVLSNQTASPWSALGQQSWYLYGLIVAGAGYLLLRQTRLG